MKLFCGKYALIHNQLEIDDFSIITCQLFILLIRKVFIIKRTSEKLCFHSSDNYFFSYIVSMKCQINCHASMINTRQLYGVLLYSRAYSLIDYVQLIVSLKEWLCSHFIFMRNISFIPLLGVIYFFLSSSSPFPPPPLLLLLLSSWSRTMSMFVIRRFLV